MYTKLEEMQVIYNLLLDYMKHQKSAVELFSEKGWKKFQNNDALNFYSEKYKKCESVLVELQKAIRCFSQAYTPEQTREIGGIVESKEQEGKRMFSEMKKNNPNYRSILKEISHNTYFSGAEPQLSDMKLLDDARISGTLETLARSGIITKEQLILYDNMMTYLLEDPDYIEIAKQNEVSNSGIRM